MDLTRYAHQFISKHFVDKRKNLAIDATCGNGHDTLFLAKLGFDKVIGFDVQTTAIENTQHRLSAARLDNAIIVQRGHQFMNEYIDAPLSCVMFNFGYLPNTDKTITTLAQSSVDALSIALNQLQKTGLMCLICYPGHPEGAHETLAIQSWLKTIDQDWQVNQQSSKSPTSKTPLLYIITRKVSTF